MKVILLAAALTSAACNRSEPPSASQTEVDKANADLADARAHYLAAAKQRLAAIDGKLDELGKRVDADSRSATARLRVRRAEVAARLDDMTRQAASGWAVFKQDVDSAVDSIAKDVDSALK